MSLDEDKKINYYYKFSNYTTIVCKNKIFKVPINPKEYLNNLNSKFLAKNKLNKIKSKKINYYLKFSNYTTIICKNKTYKIPINPKEYFKNMNSKLITKNKNESKKLNVKNYFPYTKIDKNRIKGLKNSKKMDKLITDIQNTKIPENKIKINKKYTEKTSNMSDIIKNLNLNNLKKCKNNFYSTSSTFEYNEYDPVSNWKI